MKGGRIAGGLVVLGVAVGVGTYLSSGFSLGEPASEAPGPAPRPSFTLPLPPPTEHQLDAGAERRNKDARKAWMNDKKRARPGVSVSALDRGAGVAQVRRRAELRRAPPAETGTWEERGSSNQAGRTHVTREVDGDLLVGSALGGLWRGRWEGADWEPLADNLYGGVHGVEALDGGAILVTMSESGLVYRSQDEGSTWEEVIGLGSLTHAKRLTMTSDGEQRLFLVAASGGAYQLFRSEDLGENWTAIYSFGAFGGDVWTPRTGDGRLWIAAADGAYRSDDGGSSFTQLEAMDPARVTRGELVGSEAGAPQLYLIRDGILSRSDDGGDLWTDLGAVSDYWSDLNVSILDPDLFVYGGVELHVSRDGGATFEIQNSWADYYTDPVTKLHADIQGVDVALSPDGETWYLNTDGGTYRSENALLTVNNLSLSGLRISQYYSTLTSNRNPEHIAAGAQDQGYQYTNGIEQDGDRIQEFVQAISGDYGHLTSSDGSHDYVYSVYPGYLLVQVGEDEPYLVTGYFPEDSYVPWLPPIIADPEDPLGLFFPGTQIWRYTYNPLQYRLRKEAWSEFNFAGAAGEYLSVLRFAPSDPQRAYAATSRGRFFYSSDKALTWTQASSRVPDENWYYGHSLSISSLDPDLVTIGGSGYGAPAVYRSENGGRSFAPWGEGLPDTLVYCLCEAPDGSGRIVAGTETSAYIRGPDDETWVDITTTEAPITLYWSCEVIPGENAIRFATYGRGIWDYSLPESERGCWPVEDGDTDGVDCREDCDDGDPGVHPDADELCDGIDNNCVPGDLEEQDQDGDGALRCADCDDEDAEVHPGAEELCSNARDEDCDGADLRCPPPKETGGCGCDTGSGSSAWWMSGLAVLLRGRRRV